MPDAQRIDAVRAALEKMAAAGENVVAVCNEADAALREHGRVARTTLAHIEALEADAARYRYLRNLDWWAEPEMGLEIDGSAWRVTFSSPAPFENASGGSWLDAAIDAAIEAARGIPAPKGGSEL